MTHEYNKTERYAILVRDALDDIRFKSKFEELTYLPTDLHHATRELRQFEGGPITKRDIQVFNVGIRTAIEVAVSILRYGKYDSMTQEETLRLLEKIEQNRK